MKMYNGAVVPPNLVYNRFIHFACDIVDPNGSSLDGRNSYLVTQVNMAAWPALDMGLQNRTPLKENSTLFPAITEEQIPARSA